MFQQFSQMIDTIISNKHTSLKLMLPELKDTLAIYLKEDEFRLACVDALIDSVKYASSHHLTWMAPNLYSNKKLKYSIRILFWPAFYENNPHKHKTWGVTGILHNILDIQTYELGQNMVLQKKQVFSAEAGKVGFLLPGCIHNIANLSHRISASIHLFNHIDPQHPEENAIWYPRMRDFDLKKGLIERALSVCLDIASSIRSKQAFQIKNKLYQIEDMQWVLAPLQVS